MPENKLHEIFKETSVETLQTNFFKAIDQEWMLITAGHIGHFNTMTASWGTLGILWNKPVAICFIRPHRYTFEFVEKYNYFTLSFFDAAFKSALDFCGTHSGRDTDKISQTGLKPIALSDDCVSFEQARLIFKCRKMYADFIHQENFVVREIIAKNYPRQDFHRFFIAEITQCFFRK
jgi:flavin reductase (DIM6/NTAB) family NADH-FMN oxidoreductase RutF